MNEDIATKFIGTWKLLSCVASVPDGQLIYPFGENAQGRANFERGRFSFQVVNPDRPEFAVSDPHSATETEVKEAFAGYLAYYGSWSIDPAAGRIINRVEAATIPGWVRTDQVRYYRFEGDLMILRTPPSLRDGVEMINTLTWERLPQS
jgi:hypothetical protein